MDIIYTLGIWIGLFFMLSTLSFLIKPNPLYRFTTATVVGAGVGHTTVIALNAINKLVIGGILQGQILYIAALLAGLSLYAAFFRSYSYLTRYGMAIIVGTFMGVNIGPELSSRFLTQINSSIFSLNFSNPVDFLNQLMVTIFTISVILYFVFTIKWTPPKTIFNPIQKIARYGLSIAFGYTVATYVFSRYGTLIDRLVWFIDAFL